MLLTLILLSSFNLMAQQDISLLRIGGNADYVRENSSSIDPLDVEEGYIIHGGVKYRRLSYKGTSFLMEFKEIDYNDPQPTVGKCYQLEGSAPSHLKISIGQSVSKKVPRFFIDTLHVRCGQVNGWEGFLTSLATFSIGITLPEDENDAIKDKTIRFNPFGNGLFFNGSF